MRILALFDDGNSSVKKALPEHEVVSVGIGKADIVMDLSDRGIVRSSIPSDLIKDIVSHF